ncbi:hypothetical protein VTL71DRAFT_11797 [Oculimacula yallundae]|uniref:Transcriptional regulator n=1 Tax=Oculimacula yallundae TaxID=86028 RepID=A0ABR4CTP8_9HELO
MALSEKEIVDGIHAAIKELHLTDPETLTVRNVRNKAEADMAIESGLLSSEAWKEKSKKIIKDYASQLADATEEPEIPAPKPKAVKKAAPAPKKPTPVKKVNKRAAPDSKAPATKRQKKEKSPVEEETSDLTEISPTEEESEDSAFGDTEDSDAPKKKGSKGKGRATAKGQSKSKAKVVSESEDISDLSDDDEEELSDKDSEDSEAPKKKGKAKPKAKTPVKRQSKSKAKIVDSDKSEEDLDSEASPPKKKTVPKKATPKKVTPKKSAEAVVDSDAESEDEKPASKLLSTPKKDAPNPDAGSESEMSIVLDPTPKPKRQRAPKGEKTAKAPREKAAIKAKAKPAADLSPDEAQIKTLQSQLNKCGVKKIWQFELKQYGDDNKAKIRHLQNVLKEIGMTGRYSDARAREIKEMRELQADLEAVKEGEKAWGLESGRRSRGAAPKRSMKVASDDEESDEEGGAKKAAGTKPSASKESGSDVDEDDQPPPRKRRANPELAFLSSEEDSDE